MRVATLVRTAVDAEILLVKSNGRRVARQIAFLAAAAVFGVFALGALHVGAFLALAGGAHVRPVWAALIVVGADVVICLFSLLLARTGGPDAKAIEARLKRDRALSDLRASFAIATLSGPAGRVAGRGAIGLFRHLTARRRHRSRTA